MRHEVSPVGNEIILIVSVRGIIFDLLGLRVFVAGLVRRNEVGVFFGRLRRHEDSGWFRPAHCVALEAPGHDLLDLDRRIVDHVCYRAVEN